MRNPVLLKGNNFGLTIVLDPNMDFPSLIEKIGEKFHQAKDFFNSKKQIAIKIEGRSLTSEQLEEMINVIFENSELTIAYVMEDDELVDTSFRQAVEARLHGKKEASNRNIPDLNLGEGQF